MANGNWTCVVARALFLIALCGVLGLAAPPALAAPEDLNAEMRAVVAKLTADKALAVANERRIAAYEQEALNRSREPFDRDGRRFVTSEAEGR